MPVAPQLFDLDVKNIVRAILFALAPLLFNSRNSMLYACCR